MKPNTLSIFIEANRLPPAIDSHRYSLMKTEADAVAKQDLTNLTNNNSSRASQSCSNPDMATISAHETYELEASEISLSSLLVLPEIKSMSPFNPFDETLPSPVAPDESTDSSSSTPLQSSRPPINYLPYVARTAPFDPYEEKYVAHPAGKYIVPRYKKRPITISAPSGVRMPATPMFFDDDRSLSTASSPTTPSFNSSSSSAQAVASENPTPRSVSYTPPGSPFKIPRKSLHSGAKPFTPSRYPPHGSSSKDSYQGNHHPNTDAGSISPTPRRPTRPATADFTSRSELVHTLSAGPSRSSRAQTSSLKINKPLPAVPRGGRETRPSSSVSHHRNHTHQQLQHTSRSTNRSLRKTTPLSHRAGWEQEEPSRHRTARRSNSDDLLLPVIFSKVI